MKTLIKISTKTYNYIAIDLKKKVYYAKNLKGVQ